ncbi:MAG: OmpA family protein [Polyangiaceae bacterium]
MDRFRQTSLTAAQRENGRRLASELRFALGFDPDLQIAAQRLLHALLDRGPVQLRRPDSTLETQRFFDRLRDFLEEQLEAGRLIVLDEPAIANVPEQELAARPPRRLAQPSEVLTPLKEGPLETSFEVRFVDEIGQAIVGLKVAIQAGSSNAQVSTNAAGVALLGGTTAGAGTVTVLDAAALRAIVEPRWARPRVGAPPTGLNRTVHQFDGTSIGSTNIKAGVPNIIVIAPVVLKDTFYLVRVVDELGANINGVTLNLAVGGADNALSTQAGTARLDHVDGGEASLTFSDVDALRELLRPRWDETGRADSASLVEPAADTTVLAFAQDLDAFPVAPAQMQTFSIRPKVVRARLFGQFFDTGKAFLLPSAMSSLKDLPEIYTEHPASTVLIVGHTDTQGKPDLNDPLSLERANSMSAYLTDDVDAWLAFYGDDVKDVKRWGAHEDGLMMSALPDKDTLFLHGDPIRDYQKSRGLKVDGDAGPQTRRSLISEYMALDGTTLPLDIRAVTHGCGENFPEDPEADDTSDQLNRFVELFFFDGKLGVQPPPPSSNSGPDSLEYPEWLGRARETRNFKAIPGVTTVTAARVPMRFSNRKSFPKPSALPMLKVLGQALAADPTQILVLVGNADPTGTDDANFKISLERAKAARAWLLKDKAFFLAQFKLQDEKQRWDWEEVQWMLYTARPASAPCYVGFADGFPGERTANALGAFQLGTPGLAATYVPDQETLEALVDSYVAALDTPDLPPDRVRVVGGGSWTKPLAFGQSPAPNIPDTSPNQRRLEAFLFDEEPTPPVGSFPTRPSPEPTVYTQWCSQATNELTAVPDPVALYVYDPNGGALAQQSVTIARIDADTGTVAAGGASTSALGIFEVPLANGHYFAQTTVQGNATAISFLVDADESCGAALAFEDIGGLESLSVG